MAVVITWTEEKRKAVCDEIEKWMHRYGAFYGETICQSDDCQIEAAPLIAHLVDNHIKPEGNPYDEDGL